MAEEDEKLKESDQNGRPRKSPAQSSAQAQPISGPQSGSALNASGAVLGSASDTLINGGQFMAAASVNNVTMVGCTITTEGVIPQTQTENGQPQQTTNRSRKRRRGRVRPQQDPTGHVQTSNEIYERHLREKGRGHPLWIPQSNMVLPIPYRTQGVRIGDVGIFTDDGGFDFLFNICVPIGDPINPAELPENFVPVYPSTNDICKFSQFSPGSYLASSSVTESRTAERSSGLIFESSASEGAILTMPEGAYSERLMNLLIFEKYVGTHVKDWYKFVNGPRGRQARNGDLRLVIGHDKSTSWGMAAFSKSSLSQDTNFRLKFSTLENQSSQRSTGNNYAWEYSGVAVVRVGPGPDENKGLGEADSDRLQNQCLFIRSLHAILSEKSWREAFPQTVVVADQDEFHSGIQDQSTPYFSGSSAGYAAPQSSYSPQNLPSRSHNSTASSTSSDFTKFPENSGTLDDLHPPDQMELFFRDFSSYNTVDKNVQESGPRMKFVALGSQIADEEDTSSQISSDPSFTSSEYEENQWDPAPASDVIFTYPSSCNGVLHPSQIIGQYLLEQFPDAIIAVTHDRDWNGIIDTNSCHLDSSQLLSTVRSRNDVVLDNDSGLVFLELKEKDQNGILVEEVKVAGLIKSIEDGTFTVDQYLFGFQGDQCLRLRDLCNALRCGSTDQSISMSSFLIGHPERLLSLDEILEICNDGNSRIGVQKFTRRRQSISSLRTELSLLPPQHTDRSSCLLRLADALSRRFSQWSQTDDLEEAISSYEALLSLIPNSHYQYLEALLGLCSSLYQRFYLFDQADDLKNLLKYLELQYYVLSLRGPMLEHVPRVITDPLLEGLQNHNISRPGYDYRQESGDNHGSSFIGFTPQQPRPSPLSTDWNSDEAFTSLNKVNSSSSNYMITNSYSQSGNTSTSPLPIQPTPSSLPQLSPPSSALSSYGTSRLSTPWNTPPSFVSLHILSTPQTTPLNTPPSFIPLPILSEEDHIPPKDSQAVSSDSHQPGFTHRQQLQLFREAFSLPLEGGGPFIPQPMYKPHSTSDRKRYVEDVLLEAPIYFFVEHSNPNQCGISLQDALHSLTRSLVNREQVVFEGRTHPVSIRLEWPGYRPWSRQILTKDFRGFRSPPGLMTVAKLVKYVAICVQRFILDHKSLSVEEWSDGRWRVGDGPHDIKLEDLILVSIHHVAIASWQPHLRLCRPRSVLSKGVWQEGMNPMKPETDLPVKQEAAC